VASRKYVVGRASDVADGERLIVSVNNRSIGIFNIDGKFYGLPNTCPHKGAEMCRGVLLGELSSSGPGDFVYDSAKKYVACPWHGWEFDVATGQSYFDPARTRVRTYAVDVEDGAAARDDLDEGRLNPTPEEYVRMIQTDYTLREESEPSRVAASAAAGPPPDGRVPGPYAVETIQIVVEDDYLIVDLTPPRPTRGRA
jgi:nitrite reductase/ring-hydroxylating ferredoxin subunit